jgi:hypothetical protein
MTVISWSLPLRGFKIEADKPPLILPKQLFVYGFFSNRVGVNHLQSGGVMCKNCYGKPGVADNPNTPSLACVNKLENILN